MRSWLVLLIIAVLGIGVGVATTYVEKHRGAELFFSEDSWARMREEADAREQTIDRKTAAKVEVVGDASFDFGSMERFAKMQHTFQLKSVGESPLELSPSLTTCKCTVSLVSRRVLNTGEISDITVEWTGQTMMDSTVFAQTVQVNTNDPDHPIVRLGIKGYVTETVRALPSELVVGDVSSNTVSEARFQLFGFRIDHIDILESTWEDAATAQNFDVSYEPLAKEEVEKEKGASCGLLAKVTIKPGLPLGPINQTIHIKANADKEAVIDIPVKGRALSDIRFAASPGFDPTRSILKLGALKRADSTKAVLHLYVTGDHRKDTHLSVGEVDPADYFKVSISPPKELNNGKTIQYLVTIEVPGGLPPVNRMGGKQAEFGRVVLETTHPQTKQVPIRVKFSVE
jgi:hypothetical protein